MQHTQNLLLKLPEPTDFVQVEDLNENFTKIDTEIAKITDEETGVEAKLNEHLDESKVSAHKAKNIALEDADGLFVGTELETAMKELFTSVSNVKSLVGTAITDVDNSLVVPTDPTGQQLADLIRSISTGKKVASGNRILAEMTGAYDVKEITISGLDFEPTFLLLKTPGSSTVSYSVSIFDDVIISDAQLRHVSPGQIEIRNVDRINMYQGGFKFVVAGGGQGNPTKSIDWLAME